MWAPRVKYYATAPAPATIIDLVDTLDAKFDIEVPFVDLFRWGTPESDVADITDATDIGPVSINGVTCEQYAFRQKGLDWQVWIQNGDFPLPLKLVLTTTTDEARPEHSSLYTWNLAPSYNDKAFVFDPPADAKKITFAEVAARAPPRRNPGGTNETDHWTAPAGRARPVPDRRPRRRAATRWWRPARRRRVPRRRRRLSRRRVLA